VVLILPAYFLVKLLPERRDSSEAVGAPSSAAAPGDLQARAVRVRRAVLWIGLGALLVALTSAFVGYRKLSEPVVYEPFDLSSAAGTPPEHVELSGIAQTAFLVTQRETISGHTTGHTYVPLTGLGWRSTEPVAYFIEPTSTVYVGERGPVRFDPRTPPFAVRMRGVLFSGALPGTVVAAFEKAGLKLAPKTQLLDTQPAAEEDPLPRRHPRGHPGAPLVRTPRGRTPDAPTRQSL
jgi:hypothetical protein